MDDEIDELLDEIDHGVRDKKKQAVAKLPAKREMERLDVWLGLAQTLNAIAGFPLTALLEEVDAFETLQYVTFNDETGGALETFVL